MVFDASLLNTQHYKVRIQWGNPEKGVAPSPTPGCSSYRKGSFRVTLDYDRQKLAVQTNRKIKSSRPDIVVKKYFKKTNKPSN